MRLNRKEIADLHKILVMYNLVSECKLYLFGSRLDDSKKGGDVDLLLLCSETNYKKIQEIKFMLKSEMEFALGEQRVDLTLATPERLHSDLFLQSIRDQFVEI
jgi:hypothetical protein